MHWFKWPAATRQQHKQTLSTQKYLGSDYEGQMCGPPFGSMIVFPSADSLFLVVKVVKVVYCSTLPRKEKPVFVPIGLLLHLRMFSAPLEFIIYYKEAQKLLPESCIILLYTFHNSAFNLQFLLELQLTLDNFIWLGKTSGFVFHYPILFPISKYWIKFPVAEPI